MVSASHVVIKESEFHIINNENKNMCKIFNYTEVDYIINHEKVGYKIYLYTINNTDYLQINSNDFFKCLEKYCSENLNYSLIHYVNDEEQIIKIYITPIVTSA